MDLQQFDAAISNIYGYFNTKMPNPATIKIWFVRCQSVPAGDPLKFAVDSVMNRDTVPRNIAKAIWEGYETWKKMNADRIISEIKGQKGRCDYCRSTGFIFSNKKKDKGVKYTFVSRCPRCRNWIEDVTADYPCYEKDMLERNCFTIEE